MSSTTTELNLINEINYENELIIRYDLFNLFNQVLSKRITFVHGPTGYGKTTLVSTWIKKNNYSSNTLWISIQKNGCEPNDFYYSLIISLEKYLSINISDKKQYNDNEDLLFAKIRKLMKDILSTKKHIFIIIDNFELLKGKRIIEEAILNCYTIPDNLHYIVISKNIPVAGLSQLKLNNSFLEINTSNLKFTVKEAKILLNEIYKLSLSNKEIDKILSITEGWPSILKLLALDLQGKKLVTYDIERLVKHNYYINEYISEQILKKFDNNMQDFMIKTSILGKLDYDLCMSLVDKDFDVDVLEILYRANLINKSKETGDLKYNPLLKRFLKAKLFKKDFNTIKNLYITVANLCHKKGMEIDAFEYYLQISEYSKCTSILKENFNTFLSNAEFLKLIYLIEKLPIDVILKEPTIIIYYCISLALTGRLDRNESILFLKGINLNSDYFKDYSNEILFIRIASAIIHLDLDYGLALVKNYSESKPTLKLFKEIANASLGELYFFIGDFDKSELYYKKYNISFIGKENIFLYFIAQYRIGYNKFLTGNIYEAYKIYESNLNKVIYNNEPSNYMADVFYEGLAEVHYELNNLDKSLYYINKTIGLTLRRKEYDDLICEYTLLAKILIEKKKTNEAFDMIVKINNIVEKYNNIFVLTLHIYHIVILLDKIDKIDIAKSFMLKFFSSKKSIGYFAYESQNFAAAFILFKENKLDSAINLLNKMKDSIFSSKRLTSQIEFWILMSIIKYTSGDKEAALINLMEALNIGFPNHYRRIFFDHAYYIKNIVIDLNNSKIATNQETRNYIAQLFEYINSINTSPKLKEPKVDNLLSKRENEILQLVAEGMSNIEISKQIYISESTVKKHINNIFNKLNVKNRAQAIKYYNTCVQNF